ncbi:putative reverse transcriptase domain-containing protein [Tanacetum coccineum]|uniref:Reverse transcriptase domain-containing protein n=1 Tax=Tanacetum coccineum TaxID=301880 RepID=A0ABQ5HYF0_9ASTR
MAMTIQYVVRGMILAAQSDAFKQENILAERLHGLDQQMERKEEKSLYFMDHILVPLVGSEMDEAHASRLRWEIYFVVLADATLEGMLRACVIDYGGRWGVHLPLAELSYNNSYHSRIQYALFEALYGRKNMTSKELFFGEDATRAIPNMGFNLVNVEGFLYLEIEVMCVEFGCHFKVELELSSFGIGVCEFTLSSLDVLQGFSFFLQMGFTFIFATLDCLDVGLLGDIIGEDDCDDDG